MGVDVDWKGFNARKGNRSHYLKYSLRKCSYKSRRHYQILICCDLKRGFNHLSFSNESLGSGQSSEPHNTH